VWLQVRSASLKCRLNCRGHCVLVCGLDLCQQLLNHACTHTAFNVTVHC
jgi:hypothetical protein